MGSSSSVTTICIRIECNKPCFVETNGRKHPFCGKTCAKIFIDSNLSKCSNANCNRNKFIDPSDQKVYDYCGKTYSTKYYSYCSSNCYWLETTTLTQTKLTLLAPDDLDYDVAKRPFLNGIPSAKIHGIIRIQMPKIIVDAHQILKKQPGLKSYKLFHGTKTTCDPMNITRCLKTICNTSVNNNCGVCGIITKGNDTTCSRYGGTMWFAQSSNTSLCYCSVDKGNKAMFLLDVLSNNSPDPGFLTVNQNALFC
ncbi:2401_t:CDS:2 [Entrophospora sp. SA101]|nr:14257_t:CDS:2 [Entrophospora sp. SA101]CAJ0840773.1 2401_t:CDS:2 [Entrophospora sp. SA101]